MITKISKKRISFILGFESVFAVGLYFWDIRILKWSSIALIISAFFFFIGKLLKRYLSWFLQYMFNQNITGFDKKVERPRLVFYLLFGTILILIISYYANIKPNELNQHWIIIVALFISLNTLGTFCFYMIYITWDDVFETIATPKIQSYLPAGNTPDFKKSKAELKKIYKEVYNSNKLTNSEKEFFDFLSGKAGVKINWVHETSRSTRVFNESLLDFLDDISAESIRGYSGKKRKDLMIFITKNFLKKGEIPSEKGMNNTYSRWNLRNREKK